MINQEFVVSLQFIDWNLLSDLLHLSLIVYIILISLNRGQFLLVLILFFWQVNLIHSLLEIHDLLRCFQFTVFLFFLHVKLFLGSVKRVVLFDHYLILL